jgi:hypothetical protein
MVSSSTDTKTKTGGKLNFHADHTATGTPQRSPQPQRSRTNLKRPTATPVAVAASNEEAFPLDDDTNLGSF